MEDLGGPLAVVREKAAKALSVSQAAANASPAVVAALADFVSKTEKAIREPIRDLVIDLTRVADAARDTADRDAGLMPAQRGWVAHAHLAACELEASLVSDQR